MISMVNTKVSPSLSFEGWKFSKWFTGNWSTIKEFLKIGIPLSMSFLVTDVMWQNFIVTVVGKFVIDCGEFYFSKVNLN